MSQESQAARLAKAQAALQAYQEQGSSLFTTVDPDEQQAYSRAIRLLQQRGRSEKEIRDRLAKLEFSAATIDAVVTRLQADKYLNDAEFAAEWVRQRHTMRGKSRMVLDRELREKGIGPAHRAEALSMIEEDDERAMAYKLAQKRAARINTQPADYTDYQKQLRKIVGVLARRGFGQSMSFELAKLALDEQLDSLEG